MGKLFQLQAIWTWAPNNSQMSLNTRRSKVAHVFIVSMSIKFHSVSLLCFWDTGHFEASVPNDPKMTFNPTRWNVPHYMCYYCPRIPNFSPFHSTTSRFRATGHFETNALNDLQMTFNTTRSNIPYIYMCYVISLSPKFQSVSPYNQPFQSYRLFWYKCTEWLQKWP